MLSLGCDEALGSSDAEGAASDGCAEVLGTDDSEGWTELLGTMLSLG
eukprot:CAMPEP_0119002872 /NCGR_PEP_ID=MMETSP1176-20130426/199_1 /TAXON_ID=265551 /ORGANISM="Synedropsis recta cf, Strain CCMP1620" /LENGTH=46 /DNA_ID= /DNA_START= /DNA_END= /DNA_ORIENTATION=